MKELTDNIATIAEASHRVREELADNIATIANASHRVGAHR